MNLLLIRHGQTVWNSDGKIQGHQDIELDGVGLKQAELTGLRLANFPLEKIYCSDLKRAVQTAELIGRPQEVELVTNPALRELDYGDWEGRTWAQVKQEYPSFLPEWWRNRADIPAPGGETLRQMRQRLQTFITELISGAEGNIVLVTHDGVVKALICLFLELGFESSVKFSFHNCSISWVRDLPGIREFKIICLNDFSHLIGLESKL